jgi:hypothetical protein
MNFIGKKKDVKKSLKQLHRSFVARKLIYFKRQWKSQFLTRTYVLYADNVVAI